MAIPLEDGKKKSWMSKLFYKPLGQVNTILFSIMSPHFQI